MGDFQNSDGYNYFFGEADEITRRIEEYRNERGEFDYSSQPINIPTSVYYDHHQFQNQPTMHNTQRNMHNTRRNMQHNKLCWKCLISMFISWLIGLFKHERPRSRPIHFNAYPRSVSSSLSSDAIPDHDISYERFENRPNEDSIDDIIERIQERESENIPINRGEGLTNRQISQLPTIKFNHSLEDKQCIICQSDYALGDTMTILSCTHKYHKDCIYRWLQNSKKCCICQKEVAV